MNAHELLAEMTAAPDTARYGIKKASAIFSTPAEEGLEEITFDQFHRVLTTDHGDVFQVTVVEIVAPENAS